MTQDARIRRTQFIDRTTDVRTFLFANPEKMLTVADKYCGDHCGVIVMVYKHFDETVKNI